MSAVIKHLERDRLAAVKERDALRAEVERLRVERDEYRAEVERRDALLRADGYEEMRQHAQELALRLAVAERERDEALKAKDEQLEDSERIISALVRERDEARALLQAATDNAFDAGAKAQGLEDSHRFVAMRKERDEAYDREARAFDALAKEQIRAGRAEAEVERLRGLIAGAEWVSGGYIMGPPSCPWCEGQMEDGHTPDCPAFSARGEVRR